MVLQKKCRFTPCDPASEDSNKRTVLSSLPKSSITGLLLHVREPASRELLHSLFV